MNFAIAYCFKEVRLATTSGSDLERNNNVGNVSTVMGLLTGEDGEILSHFDKISETQAENINTSWKRMLIYNHEIEAIKGKIWGQLALEHFHSKKLLNNPDFI